MNKLKTVKFNDFNKLIQLEELNLKKNFIETIDKYSFNSNVKLKSLNLQSNLIININSNTFNGLNALWSLDLLKNPVKIIDSFSFYNTSIKKIFITMPNISVENMFNLKTSLKPISQFKLYNKYDTEYSTQSASVSNLKTLSVFIQISIYLLIFLFSMIVVGVLRLISLFLCSI